MFPAGMAHCLRKKWMDIQGVVFCDAFLKWKVQSPEYVIEKTTGPVNKMISASFLAENSVSSPQKIFFFTI